MKAKLLWAVPVAAMAAAVWWGAQARHASVSPVVVTTTLSGPPIG
jgi:cytochrome c-type biogenesis protein CcmH/NrfF